MALNGNSDDTNGYNSVIKNGESNNANHVKAVIPPIGSIMAWAKTITGTPALPDGWEECDGSAISDSDSPMNGQNLPDLNSTQRFLRGAGTSGTTGGADTHALTEAEMPSHYHTYTKYGSTENCGSGGISVADNAGSSDNTGSTGSGSAHNNLPAYYEVVFIMRIK